MIEVSNRRKSPKPYYRDDSVTIYHGDCCDLPQHKSPVRVITDPPYGSGAYATDVAPDTRIIAGWLSWADTASFFGYPESLVAWCIDFGRTPEQWITWWPTNKVIARGRTLPRETECVAIFGDVPGSGRLRRARAEDSFARRYRAQRGDDPETALLGDVWRDPSPGVRSNSHLRQHPNEKPLSLLIKLVTLCSNEGDVIIDPFMGSGTTLVAAKQMGRKAIGFEVEESYCAVAAERCAQEVLELSA